MEQVEDSSLVHTMDIEEFIECSEEHGYTMAELLRAEDEVHVSLISKTYRAPNGTMAKRIIEDLAADEKGGPWRGPLPPPRRSPRRTIGDAIAAAKVCSKTRSIHLSHSLSPNSAQPSRFHRISLAVNLGPTPRFKVNGSGRRLGDQALSAQVVSNLNSNTKSSASFKHQGGLGRVPLRLCLSSSMLYRPTPGLVALFARTGTTIRNPRAPHITSRTNATFSFIDATSSMNMDNDNANHQHGGGYPYRSTMNQGWARVG
jgi:hypothetical protein